MKLTRFSKQIIAVVCAVAMVIAGLAFVPSADAKADAPDWSTIDYLGDGAGGGTYTNKYKFYAENGTQAVNIQHPGFSEEDGIYIGFPAADIQMDLAGYAVQGAGACIYLSNFTQKVTEFTVSWAGGSTTCYVYYEDGTEGPTTTQDPSAPTAEPTTANPWKAIDNGGGQWFYNNVTKQNISNVVNIQKPGWAQENGVYITVPAGISKVNVNGVETGVAAVDGAGFVVYLSAMTKKYNDVTITHGLGTSYIQIENTNGSEEPTTEAPTGETESTEAPTTTEAQVPGAPVGLVANLMQDNTVVYIAHGPASGTVTGYKYYIDDVENPDLYNGVNYPVSNFNPGQTYTLKVTAYNDAGEGPAATATFTIPLPAGYYNVADYKSTTPYTYPTKEGKIFAGWYTDDTCTEEYTETTGVAYAKFVDEKVLTVKFQKKTDNTAVRFVSTIDDCVDYQSAGFDFSGNYGAKVIGETSKTVTKVYKTIKAGGQILTPSVAFENDDSAYFFTYTVRGMDGTTGSDWSVTPFYVTPDGTKVSGVTDTYAMP